MISTHVLQEVGINHVKSTLYAFHSQPVSPSPPEGKQEERREDERRDLARIRVKSARNQGSADEARAKVPSG